MSKKKARKNPVRRNEGTLVRKLVSAIITDEVPRLSDVLGNAEDYDVDEAWEQLLRHHGYPELDETVKHQERIQALVPEDRQGDLIRYFDSETARENAIQDAAYAVGIAVGLRFARGAR